MIQPYLEKKDIDFSFQCWMQEEWRFTAFMIKLGNCIQQTNAHVLTDSSFKNCR